MLLAPMFALVFLIRHKLRFSRKSMFFIFWMGLNDSYDHIIGQILVADFNQQSLLFDFIRREMQKHRSWNQCYS